MLVAALSARAQSVDELVQALPEGSYSDRATIVSGGEKIPRKGGPGITRSDLLVINKIDLAPPVGADLEVMRNDTQKQRGPRAFVFTDMRRRRGLDEIVAFIEEEGGLTARRHPLASTILP